MSARTYLAVPGFFAQDSPDALPSSIGALPDRFGLLDASRDRWTEFKRRIDVLNRGRGGRDGERYKVFWLARHGQGYHNVAEAKYGTEAWDDYWSKLTTDGDIVWGPDPLLTPLGVTQAQEAAMVWAKEREFSVAEVQPEVWFLSPLRRALDTFAQLGKGRGVVLENCREEYGIHTCDQRSPLSFLLQHYPEPLYAFERDFAEEDPVWTADEREAKSHIVERARSVLDRAFSSEFDDATYIGITAHGGFINGFLEAVGRRHYALPTGGVLPVVVKCSVVRN